MKVKRRRQGTSAMLMFCMKGIGMLCSTAMEAMARLCVCFIPLIVFVTKMIDYDLRRTE